MKQCGKCGETKDRTAFHKKAASKDGLKSMCKACAAAHSKVYRAATLQDRRASARAWKKNNPIKRKAIDNTHTAKRRAKLKKALGSLTSDEQRLIKQVYAEAARITKQTGIMHHVDHIIPLSRGGKHQYLNLQILTEEQNLLKGNRILIDGKYY